MGECLGIWLRLRIETGDRNVQSGPSKEGNLLCVAGHGVCFLHLGVTGEGVGFTGQMWGLVTKTLVNCAGAQNQDPHGGWIRHEGPGEKKVQEDTVFTEVFERLLCCVEDGADLWEGHGCVLWAEI